MKMNFLVIWFLSAINILNNFPNFLLPNRQEIVSTTVRSLQTNENIRYDNFAVYGIRVRNLKQRAVLKKLTDSGENLDLWLNNGENFHIMVNPNFTSQFKNIIRLNKLQKNTKILIPNVQSLIDKEFAIQRRRTRQSFSWNRYHNLDEINHWLTGMIAQYSNWTTYFSIGSSTEGRSIHGIKISYKAKNPGIFIESHIHAREWITSATATWIINELLTSKDFKVRYLAENYDWYIVPVVNVDGFVYSHEKDRLWRKTRSRHSMNSNPECVGVDANRNYNSHWMKNGGATLNPCADVYAGPFPFSEPEVLGLATFVSSIKDKINILLSFHSYGQNLLSPFGYTNAKKPNNYRDMMQVASAFSDTVANLTYGTRYHNGTTAETLYLASGCTVDWAYEQGIRLTYTIEFRDQGEHGFLLPPTDIIPNSKETLAGILALVTEADNLGYMSLKNYSTPKSNFHNLFKWPRL